MYKKGILVLTIAALVIVTVSCASKSPESTAEQSLITTVTSVQSESSSSTQTQTAASTKSSAASEPASQSASTASPSPTVTQKASEVFTPDANLDAMLDRVSNLEEGTAGSSLKQAADAGALLDWSESTSLKQKGIEAQISHYFESLGSASAVDQFVINFAIISNTAQLIIDKDQYTLSCTSDSGYIMAHDTYTQSKWDNFSMAVQVSADAY